ncbi:MAG: lysylphosphatidylglycerol synthase transmembrane domain-containing protein [Desulfomonilaceae bacterium]
MDNSAQTQPTGTRKLLWSALSIGFVIAFLAACVAYVWSHRDDFSFLATASHGDLTVAAACVLLSYVLNSYQLGLFLVKLGLQLSLGERLALTMAMMLGNLVIPLRGGSAALAVYLKAVHHFDFASFAIIYGGTALLMGLINSALALGALAYLAAAHGFYQPVLMAASGILFFGTAYFVCAPPPTPRQCKGVLGVLFRISQGWRLITMDKPLMRALIFSTALIVLCLLGAFWCIYQATHSPISFWGVLVTSSLGNVANLAPFTPGSLGIFDAVAIQIPLLFDLDLPRSMAATFLFRTLCFGWALLFGLPASWYMARNIRLARTKDGSEDAESRMP